MFLKHLVAAAALAGSFAFGSAMAQTPPALPSTSFNVVGSIGGLSMYTSRELPFWTVTVPKESGGAIKVRIERAADTVRLCIRDTGPGIDRDTQARLFEPFFTTRASDGGTGLGLAVVRAIVQEHGATIDVHSAPGAGAEFIVSFQEASRG